MPRPDRQRRPFIGAHLRREVGRGSARGPADARYAKQTLDTTDMTAQRAIAALIDAGVLTERTGLRRNRFYQQEDVLAALESFARRIHRR